MSDIYSTPATPQTPSAPAPAAPEGQADLAGQWRSWMGDPANRAALIQMGISLMQPVALGQSGLGHVGQAVGSAGEAQDRIRKAEQDDAEQRRRQQETDSRGGLREAQAGLAEARAGTAGARSDAAATRAEAARERLTATQQNIGLSKLIQAQRQYAQEIATIQKRNTDLARDPKTPLEPVPSWDEWKQKYGLSSIGRDVTTSEAPEGVDQGTIPARPTAYPGARYFAGDAKFSPGWYITEGGKTYKVQQ